MNKGKKIYFGILLMITFFLSTTFFSYAFFTSKNEEHGKLNIVVGTLSYKIESDGLVNNQITVEANSVKRIKLKVTSLNEIDSKYELYYWLSNELEGVEIGYSTYTSDIPSGTMQVNESKEIIVGIKNNSNERVIVNFGVEGGFTNQELILKKGNSLALLTNICEYEVGQNFTFDYTGSSQTFEVPCDGKYQLESWGASGEVNDYVLEGSNGLGAYTSGKITLMENKKIYVYVGGSNSGFNGGSYAESYGGGATDFRLALDNINSRIMVAAGGGGGIYIKHATVNLIGDAGGLIGYDADATISGHEYTTGYSGKGATQTTGGATGIYGTYEYTATMDGTFGQGGYYGGTASGGGGGWYGGGHGRHPGGTWPGGGGGSSYISGHAGCLAVSSNYSTELIQGCDETSTSLECSISYTGYYFSDTIMIDGKGYNWTNKKGDIVIGMPTHDGTTTMTGNSGNGYAKITYLGD